MNEPAASWRQHPDATLNDLHGPLRRVPHRCVGDLDRPLLNRKATAASRDKNDGQGHDLGRCDGEFSEA